MNDIYTHNCLLFRGAFHFTKATLDATDAAVRENGKLTKNHALYLYFIHFPL